MNPILQALSSGYGIKKILNYLSSSNPAAGKKIAEALSYGYPANEVLKYVMNAGKSIFSSLPKSNPLDNNIYNQMQYSIPEEIEGLAKVGFSLGAGYIGSQLIGGNDVPEPEAIDTSPQPIQPGPDIGQQMGQNVQAPVADAMQPTSATDIAQAAPALQPNIPQPTTTLFQQLTGNVNENEMREKFKGLDEKQKNELKFLGMISNQLEEKGKTINDPEVKQLGKKIKDVLKGKLDLTTQETARFKGQYPDIEQEDINDDGKGMKKAFDTIAGGTVSEKLYEGIFDSLRKGKDTYAGIKDPLIQKAKPFFDKGLIKSPQDLKDFVNQGPESLKKPANLIQVSYDPTPIENSKDYEKGDKVVSEDGNLVEIKGISGNNFLIEEDGKLKQVPMESLRGQPESIKKSKVVFDPSTVPEDQRSAQLAISIPLPDRSAIINMFHDGSFYLYKRKDGKPLDEDIVRRVIDGFDIPITSGESIMGGWNSEKGDSRGSASHKELVSMAQSLEKMSEGDDPTKPLIFEKITDSFTHGFLKEFQRLLKEAGRQFSAKPKKPKK